MTIPPNFKAIPPDFEVNETGTFHKLCEKGMEIQRLKAALRDISKTVPLYNLKGISIETVQALDDCWEGTIIGDCAEALEKLDV